MYIDHDHVYRIASLMNQAINQIYEQKERLHMHGTQK